MGELSLGEKIKFFRKRRGLSQLELEMEIEASPGSVSRIESGKVNPSKETLLKIANVLKLQFFDTSYLFDIEIKDESFNLHKISEELSHVNDLNQLYHLVTHRLARMMDMNYTSIWEFRKESNVLHLMNFTGPENAKYLFEKLSGINIFDLHFDLNNEGTKDNYIVKAMNENRMTYTTDMYQAATTLVPRLVSDIFKRILNMRSTIHFPLQYKADLYGVLGIIIEKEFISENEIHFLKLFAKEVSIAIHNIKNP